MIWRAIDKLSSDAPIHATVLYAIAISAGLLLLVGLWTPIVGIVLGLVELGRILSKLDDPSISILLGTIGIALALLGPGLWSVDARLYGWKVINLPPREGKSQPAE